MMKYIRNFFTKRKKEMEDESGAIVVIAAAAMVILLVFAAFVIDFGHVYIENAKLQTACDAAARAAALKYDPSKTGCDKTSNLAEVRYAAKRIMKANGYTIEDSDIVIDEASNTIEVKKLLSVDTSFAKVININKMNTQKSATVSVSGGKKKLKLDYALFSGSQYQNLPVNGATAVYGGDVHTNSAIEYNGTGSSFYVQEDLTYVQDYVNADRGTTTAGSSTKTSVEPMPDYHDALIGALPKESQYIYYADLNAYVNANPSKLSGDTLTIDGNVRINECNYCPYNVNVTGNLLINSYAGFAGTVTVSNRGSIRVLNSSGVAFMGATVTLDGYIIAEGDISFQDPCRVNCTNNWAQSAIYSVNANVHFYGNSNVVYGLIYAPYGEISVANGYSIYVGNGGVIAEQINTSEGSLSVYANPSIEWDDDVVQDSSSGGSGGTIKLVK